MASLPTLIQSRHLFILFKVISILYILLLYCICVCMCICSNFSTCVLVKSTAQKTEILLMHTWYVYKAPTLTVSKTSLIWLSWKHQIRFSPCNINLTTSLCDVCKCLAPVSKISQHSHITKQKNLITINAHLPTNSINWRTSDLTQNFFRCVILHWICCCCCWWLAVVNFCLLVTVMQSSSSIMSHGPWNGVLSFWCRSTVNTTSPAHIQDVTQTN